MKAVAPHDRPREKLARLGAAALGDNELMAIVIGQGQAQASALDVANALLTAVGGIECLSRARLGDLVQIRGFGAARAAQVLAAAELGRRIATRGGRARVQVTNPRSVAEFLMPQYGNGSVEQFGIVLLDTKHKVLQTTILSVGTLDASIVHPREIFREAAAGSAAAIVLFHNHPSGDPEPSREDRRLTERLIAAGVLMGIDVLDHIILGDGRYFSFREKGTL
jgi:DNA repair protein RadC